YPAAATYGPLTIGTSAGQQLQYIGDFGQTELPNFGNLQTAPALAIDKVFVNVTGGNGNAAADAAGDVLNYTVKVTNTGNITLAGVPAVARRTGQNISGLTLAVGASQTYSTSYTLTQADLDNKGNSGGDGSIHNTATADSNETASVSDSAEVPLTYNPA